MKLRHKVLVSGLVLVVGGFGAGVAVASIPDSSGTIHGCYNTITGALRVVDDKSCNALEKAITWDQQGPAGLPGPQGAQGAQGAQGPQGPAGAGAPVPHQAVIGTLQIVNDKGDLGDAMDVVGTDFAATHSQT